MTFEEICRRNSAAVDTLPAKGPVQARVYSAEAHAAEEWMPWPRGDEAHAAAVVIPHRDDGPGKSG